VLGQYTIGLLDYELLSILLSLINFHKNNIVTVDFRDTSGTNITSILNGFKSKLHLKAMDCE
jgi:hypothetical protein